MSIDMVSLSPYFDMQEAQKQGITFAGYFMRGTIPIPQVTQYQRAWEMLVEANTERADRQAHDMDIDEDTGEVLN